MKNLTCSVIVLTLGFSGGGLSSTSGQESTPTSVQSKAVIKTGATVSGRVTVQGKGKAGIVVGLRGSDFGPGTGPGKKAVTDADGNYRITDIPAGNYQIIPMTPIYITTGVNSLSGIGKALLLAEGERVEGIDFSLIRGGVITGKVTQADGKPLVEERLALIAVDPSEQQGRQNGLTSFQTDDRGIYRAYGLAPGRYKVGVGLTENQLTPNRSRAMYPRTFYPDVSEVDQAKAVELGEGSEVTNIDIKVGRSLQGFSVSGILLDGETGQPIPTVRLGLQRIVGTNEGGFAGAGATSTARGEFRIENLLPGKYSLFVLPQPNTDVRVEPLVFEILDQEVSGLTLRTVKGAAISGVLVIEGNSERELYSRLAQLRLFAYVRGADGPDMAFSRVATIAPDGTFRFGGLQAGSAMFQLSSQERGQSGFVIARIERDGVVQPRSTVEIKAGEQVAGVRIVLGYGTGAINGNVKWETGPIPSDVHLFVRLTKPNDTASTIRPQEVDARGKFVFRGLPAGTYSLTLSLFNQANRNRPQMVRQEVTVTDGVVTEVEMTMSSTSNPSPNP